MPGLDIFQEADRQLTICNACRYCEGFCPVFQAIETRWQFKQSDVLYLSNLCHDCRACYYACMFTPPHEFAVNIPQVLSDARTASYRRWSWPKLLASSFGDRRVGIVLACIAETFIVVIALLLVGPNLFARHIGPGSLYEVIPYHAMVVPALILMFYWIAIWGLGGFRFWSEAGNAGLRPGGLKEFVKAASAALSLRYLGGGGPGCNYPEERPTSVRRVYHAFVFWGFVSDFVSTSLAFLYQDLLHRFPPYPIASAPVISGSLGGVALIIGTVGLIWIKAKSDQNPAGHGAYGMDYLFLVILGLTALTGMLTLFFRATAALGLLLSVHLGLVAALFITAPYGKFVHALYRSLALIQYQVEQNQPSRPA